MLRLTGRRREDVVGKGVFEVYPQNPGAPQVAGPESLRTSLQRAIDTREPDQMPLVRYDLPIGQGNFQVRYWQARNTPVLSPAGEVLFLLHSTADVTEAVLARQKVQESEERFGTLVAQAPVAIGLTRGPDQVFESINASMLPVIGKEHAGEVIGKPVVEVLPELRGQPVLDLIRRVYQTGEPFQGLEVPVTLRMHGQLRQGYFHADEPSCYPLVHFLNEKRFLSLDLTYGYPIRATVYEYLMENGMSRQEYHWFLQNQVKARCVMGNDYYMTNG
ncbi:MAG: dTDP-4-dehydrorhamnose reductase [uncultured Cytophagales bacterium]|uniref:dTDP-4-dehydrorhamnose reductase n=1 Tax=uncultured Cytophagales bacterium TaxID=158755 RepID=A0A6J4LP64_9SPHI|nr:MAG: dTDP-4-dehydrorhamnose reductase [uncultured Cytophagales bacterium]